MAKAPIKHKPQNDRKAPIIDGLSASEIRIWVSFCKSIYKNLNK